MKQRTSEFDEWVGGASDEEIEIMISNVRKRKYIFLGVWAIALVVTLICLTISGDNPGWVLALALILLGIPAGCSCFCNNNLRILKRRKFGGAPIDVYVYLIIGLFIVPIIVVQLASKIDSLGAKILGY